MGWLPTVPIGECVKLCDREANCFCIGTADGRNRASQLQSTNLEIALPPGHKLMVQQPLICDDYYVPDANSLVTEDDTPVDNFASEKQQRLLVCSLYSSWQEQTFLAAANVGVFHTDGQPAIVPDVFLSFDVQVPENWWDKQNRSYLVWKFGKPPEVVIEIVSNKVGDELGNKLKENI